MSMELRMLLAIVLSFLIFFLYQTFFVKEVPVPQKTPATKFAEGEDLAPRPDDRVKEVVGFKPLVESEIPTSQRQGRTITVFSRLYVAELTENGGAFRTFKLREYRESLALDSPLKELVRVPKEKAYTPEVSFLEKALAGLEGAAFLASTPFEKIDATETNKEVTFSWTSPDGISIVKSYTFSPDTYDIGLEVKVKNLSSQTIQDNLTVSLINHRKAAEESRYVFSGPAALINGELEEIKVDKIADDKPYSGRIAWVACEDQYFVSAIVPEESREATMKLHMSPRQVLSTTYVDPSSPVEPGTERTYRYTLYFGPKSLQCLRQAGPELQRILDFGFFDIIAKPLLHAMNFLYRHIPNYGIAIIIITILVKLLFWPLSNKSYKSMSQMKRLQPKMAELRAKYKHDKKMMNQELMNLYKVYKVNPLGGCLPMVLQIPVFFAFYKMLYQAIELRHATFFLWINDLSAPDRLFHFGFKVPMMTPPYGIPVLTIIMGASMFLQQKMSPPPGDPTQAKMMMFMPIFFTFIFINFPSGLVLYWLFNNILSMGQQYYISKKMA